MLKKQTFEQGFCMDKGDIRNEFWQNCRFCSNVWTSGTLAVLFDVDLCILDNIFKLVNFSWKIVTSLAFNFSMLKSLFKIIFGR